MKVQYTHTCSICGADSIQTWDVQTGAPPPSTSPPHGWRDVMGMPVCSQHRIQADLYLDHPDSPIDDAQRRSLWRAGLEL